MKILRVESEADAIDIIANEDGYRFVAKGEVTDNKIREWIAILGERLKQENVIKSSSDIETVIVIEGTKKKLTGRSSSDMKIISLSDYYEDIDVVTLLVILNQEKIVDDFNMRNIIPLILDCETIDELFNNNGEYVGFHRELDTYMGI